MNKPLSLLTISIVSILMFLSSCTTPATEPVASAPVEHTQEKEVIKPYYKNADDFAKNWDKKGTLSQAIKEEAFDLYNGHKWDALFALFIKDSLNKLQPPGEGGFNNVKVKLKKGLVYDRYSGDVGFTEDSLLPMLGGQFTSPVLDDHHYSFGERALGHDMEYYDFFYEIEVLEEPKKWGGLDGDVIPWYGKPGLGKQTMWDIPVDPASGTNKYNYTWNQLAEMGYIKVTILGSPSGKYTNYVNKVIE